MATDQPEATADLLMVRAALRAEAPAIEQLAQRLRCVPRILGAWNARMGRPLDEHDLADLVQDVVVIILEKLDEYAGRAPFEAWIYRICRLELMNGVRRKGRARRRESAPLEDLAGAAQPDALSADFDGLYSALDRLGGVEAEAVRLKHFDGLTFDEIGVRLAISANTAKTRYYRAMLKLEQLLRNTTNRGKTGGTDDPS